MGKLSGFFKKWKSRLVKQANLWILVEVAAVLLLLTVAANYVISYVGSAIGAESLSISWQYIYTNSAEPPAASADGWNTANAFNPMSKDKTGAYLHMRGTLDGDDSERTMVVKTDYAPLKISLGGAVAYDNHYGKSDYTGNRYNAVVIPPSDGRVTVAISAYLPFSADIQTTMANDQISPAFALTGSMVYAAVMLALGLILAVVSVVLVAVKKKKPYSFAAAGLAVVYAVVAALPALAGGSYWLNAPAFYGAALAAEISMVVLLAAVIQAILKIRDKLAWLLLALSAAAAVAMVFVPDAAMLKLVWSAALLLNVAALAMIARRCYALLRQRVQYANGIFAVLVFLMLLELLCGAMRLTLRYRIDFALCFLIGLLVALCFVGFILVNKTLSGNNAEAIAVETAVYVQCVERIAGIMKQVLACRTETDICRTTADGVQALCSDIFTETEAEHLAYVAAVKQEDGYRRVCDRALDEPVNYTAIENRCLDMQQMCIFTETYLEFVFLKNGDFHMVFHFENIQNGLSSFFTSMMSVLYSCVEVALDQLAGDTDAEQREIEVFTKLATDTEIASGNNRDHLEFVAYYTHVMMQKMGYPAAQCDMVSRAAMLHDIGKTAIPVEITNKPGLLSESEREIVKKHTQYGCALLSAFHSDFMECAAVIAAQHHERYDGKGYNGQAGEDINAYARIVTVADTLDALTTRRSYKEAWSLAAAVAYIDAGAGTMYDPKVVAALHEGIDEIKTKITEKNQ